MFWAKMNKFIGYLLWKCFPLRIKRQQLTLPNKEGSIQLKDPQLQVHVWKLDRTL